MFDDQRVELLPERTTLKGWRKGRGGGGGNQTAVALQIIVVKGDNNIVNATNVAFNVRN